MYKNQFRRPFLYLVAIVLIVVTLLTGLNGHEISTSQAAPLLDTVACFPTAVMTFIRVSSSPAGDNYYGDHLIDFDGDGRTDIFTMEPDGDIKFSSGAKQPWQILQTSPFPLTNFRYGDFDGDGKTDIFYYDSSQWLFSSGGVGEWERLQLSSLSGDDLRFGNFDDDPRTDVFYRAPSGDWFYSSGGTGALEVLGPSSVIPVDKYRFADLDGNGKTDIFRVGSDGQWYISYDGATAWTPGIFLPTITVDQLRFGQFDDQPGADVFFEFNNNWLYSSSGKASLKVVGSATKSLAALRLGDFDGNGRSDMFSIAQNKHWQVDFDVVGDPQFLWPTVETPGGLLTCISSGTDAAKDSWYPVISSDGNKIVFSSNADLLGQGNVNGMEIWLFDRQTEKLSRITTSLNFDIPDSGFIANFSGDGKKIVFESNADLLGQGTVTGTEIWLYDIASESLERITTASSPDRNSRNPTMDETGQKITFISDSDFLGQGLPENQSEIWLYDTVLQNYSRITTLSESSRLVYDPVISRNGDKVVFYSDSDFLNQGIPEEHFEIWLYDVANSNNLTRLTTGTAGTSSGKPQLNAAGDEIIFSSDMDFHGEGILPGQFEIWRMALATGALERITYSQPGNLNWDVRLSEDENTIVFTSNADFFGEGISIEEFEIWRYNVPSGSLSRLTQSPGGSSFFPSVSGNGRLVVFQSNIDFSGHGDGSIVQPDVWLLDTIPPVAGDFKIYLPAVVN